MLCVPHFATDVPRFFGAVQSLPKPRTQSPSSDSIREAAREMALIHVELDQSVGIPQKHREQPQTTRWSISSALTRPSPSQEPAPSGVYALFLNDLNILKIHQAVRSKYSSMLFSAISDRAEIEEMRSRADVPGLSLVERVEILTEAFEKEKYVEGVETYAVWDEYVERTGHLLEEYAPLASDEARGEVQVGQDKDISDELSEHRVQIILSYLEIVRDYISVSAYRIGESVAKCPLCGIPVCDSRYVEEFGKYVCDCGRETVGVVRHATFRDNNRIDTGSKNIYNDLANFIKRIDAFEGKQRSRPPQILYVQLAEYLDENRSAGEPTVEEIRGMPLNSRDKKEGTSIEILVDALLKTRNSYFYRDSELIAHELWGWKLPDLTGSGLRRMLISDYIATQKVYEEVKERWSSLNVNLRLYFHLRTRGYECDIEDFKSISSKRSLNYHAAMIAIMCIRTGLNFVPLLGSDPIENILEKFKDVTPEMIETLNANAV